MNYEYVWKVLEALAIEMRERGQNVPQEAIEDLKSAKTLFTVQHVDPNAPIVDAQLYLDKAEVTLLSLAESCIGKKYVDDWLRRIEDARVKGLGEKSKPAKSFVAGVPKGQDWVRIRTTDIISSRDMYAAAARLGLECKSQEHDSILVYGKSEDIKRFIKEIAEKTRPKKQG